MAMIIHHVRTAPELPSKVSGRPVPERLEQLIMDCLAKAPGKRPGTAMELWHALGEVPLENPWTPERAEAWWRDNLPELAAPTTGDDLSGDLTLERID
jgi:serine/threonine-protein kinase